MKDVSAMENEELLREAFICAARLTLTRNDIELDPDAATEEEAAEDAAGACFGEGCCDDKPVPEVTELLRRLNRLTTLEANERMAYEHNRQVAKGR